MGEGNCQVADSSGVNQCCFLTEREGLSVLFPRPPAMPHVLLSSNQCCRVSLGLQMPRGRQGSVALREPGNHSLHPSVAPARAAKGGQPPS